MKSKGFTLIELAVVLAIIAVLAAVLTPLVSGYLDQARIARAQADVRTVADAIKLHQRDTGRYPVYLNTTEYGTGTIAGGTNKVIAGPGTAQTYSGLSASWTAVSNSLTTLETWINGNFTVVAANPFPRAGFRGPYVAAVESDPWGNQYVLTAQHLAGSSLYHAFVVSPGPNGVLDTAYSQDIKAALVLGTDDIVAVIK